MSFHDPISPGWWFGTRPPPWWARFLAMLYSTAAALRRSLYWHGWWRVIHVPVPVVVVGNLIAGGSGKTPLVIALVERLRADGWTPGVASRGYGRIQSSTARWVEATTPPHLGGDEPVLIAMRTGAKVRVDRDRVAAAQALAAAGCDVVVCDDGLQHYRLHRDVELEVVDGQRRYGNARLIPAGPLREPVWRGARCDFQVLNLGTERAHPSNPVAAEDGVFHADAEITYWPMLLEPGYATPITGGRPVPLQHFTGLRVHAVAGIGDPERFFSLLRGWDMVVIPHAFPDHHAYHSDDFQFASRHLPILMTEKDAVKCGTLATADMYAIPITSHLPEAFWMALMQRISAAHKQFSGTYGIKGNNG